MNFDAITDYLTVAEVAERWKLPANSLYLNRAVMRRVLKVCTWVRGDYGAMALKAGQFAPLLDADEQPLMRQVNAWCYPAGASQIGSFEMSYSMAFDNSGDEPVYYALERPLLLSELLTVGVVMPDDLDAAEEVLKPHQAESWQAKTAATKEKQSLLRILSAVLDDAYRYDPRQSTESSEVLAAIQKASTATGKPMHPQTIAKYLQQSVSDYPPQYMTRPSAAKPGRPCKAPTACMVNSWQRN